jgi:RNase P/RNase MRP subunit POP5
VITPEKEKTICTRYEIISALQQQCKNLFGKNCKALGIFLTRYNANRGVIRCFHTETTETIQLLRSIQRINDKKVTVDTIGTSGTIKTLLRKYFDGNSLQNKRKNKYR